MPRAGRRSAAKAAGADRAWRSARRAGEPLRSRARSRDAPPSAPRCRRRYWRHDETIRQRRAARPMRIEESARPAGRRPRHEAHVLRRWAQALPQASGRRRLEDFLPQALRAALPALSDELAGLARLQSEHAAEDGSARLLVALADGQTVEAVLLPRDGLCVSTQVGCAVGCVFCMTGQGGLQRQLGSAEIVAQVALARTRRPVHARRVHGHGRAGAQPRQRARGDRLAGHRRRRGPQEPGLLDRGRCAGLRAPAARAREAGAGAVAAQHPAALRAELLPRAPRIEPAELVAAGEAYARATRLPDPVPVDAAGRRQRRRRRGRRHRRAAGRQATR